MGWLKGKSLLPMWLVLIGASIIGADQASACSCVGPPPNSAASVIERADVAFGGEVVDVDDGLGVGVTFDGLDERKAMQLLFSELRAELRALTPLKGQPGDIVTVYTHKDEAMCGYHFRKGERLKVVAWYRRGQRLSTSVCAMMDANNY